MPIEIRSDNRRDAQGRKRYQLRGGRGGDVWSVFVWAHNIEEALTLVAVEHSTVADWLEKQQPTES